VWQWPSTALGKTKCYSSTSRCLFINYAVFFPHTGRHLISPEQIIIIVAKTFLNTFIGLFLFATQAKGIHPNPHILLTCNCVVKIFVFLGQ